MKLAKYRVIHWYIDKLSLEFLNIGVVVFDNERLVFKLIDSELLSKIKANFIDKTIMSYTISHIQNILEKCKNESDLDRALVMSYQDNFKFSEIQLFNVFNSLSSELDELFYRYISYKFSDKQNKQQNTKEHITQAVKELANREFRNYVKFMKKDGFDFSLIVKEKEYPSILGSIESKDDISRAFNRQLEIPNFSGIYGITTQAVKNKNRETIFKNTLVNIGYNPIQFADKEQIHDSLEVLLGVA